LVLGKKMHILIKGSNFGMYPTVAVYVVDVVIYHGLTKAIVNSFVIHYDGVLIVNKVKCFRFPWSITEFSTYKE